MSKSWRATTKNNTNSCHLSSIYLVPGPLLMASIIELSQQYHEVLWERLSKPRLATWHLKARRMAEALPSLWGLYRKSEFQVHSDIPFVTTGLLLIKMKGCFLMCIPHRDNKIGSART